MKVLTVINTKGGSSKTTTAVCLAAALGRWWGKTLLLDADVTQQSAADWSQLWGKAQESGTTTIRVPYEWAAVAPDKLAAAVEQAESGGCEWVVIDTIGTGLDPEQITPALSVADLALIPSADSLMDLHAIRPTVRFCQQAAEHNSDLGVLVVLTQVRSGTATTPVIRQQIEAQLGLSVLESVVPMRERLKQGLGAAIGSWNPLIPVAYEVAGEPAGE